MFNWMQAHLPVTTSGWNGVPCFQRRPIWYELVNNILLNNNVACYWFMDQNMVLSWDYTKWKKGRWRTNAPLLQAISTATRTHWSNTERIAQCHCSLTSLHRKPLDAAIGQLLAPYCPDSCQRGQQSTKRWCNMYPLCWPFRLPSQCGGTILCASPDGGGSWLS
jgi:hypothetical protein